MKVLVACEESQAVTIAFRERGHEAYSCDILPCSGGHPEWHIQDDVLKHLTGWDLIIAHPPCTYLTVTGNKWMLPEYEIRFPNRKKQREEAIKFFMKIVHLPCNKIAIENPVGIMSTEYKPPDQIIQPYYFGDEAQKATCLWLKNVHPLFHCAEDDLFFKKTHVGKGEMMTMKSGTVMPKWYACAPLKDRAKLRSKTFPGIASAMAEQWGEEAIHGHRKTKYNKG